MTEQQAWSPEPWAAIPLRGGGGTELWTADPDGARLGGGFTFGDGRRIEKCVNACAGIANPEAIGEVVAIVREMASGGCYCDHPCEEAGESGIIECDECGARAALRKLERSQ